MKTATQSPLRILFLLPIMVAGCIGTDSEHPVSKPSEAKPMTEIIGTWDMSMGSDQTKWEIALAGTGFPSGIHTLYDVSKTKTLAGYFFVSRIGDKRIVNLIQFDQETSKTWQPKEIDYYSIFACRVVKGNIELLTVDEKFLRKAIEQGSIGGELQTDEWLELDGLPAIEPTKDEKEEDADVLITASSKQLNAFIASNFEKLFAGAKFEMRPTTK